LNTLLRPIAIIQPDIFYITMVMLQSIGIIDPVLISKKIELTMKISTDILSI
jgi:hypothetical protein